MSQLTWLPEALADVDRLYEFIHSQNPQAAGRAAEVILDGVDELLRTPEIGRPMADGTARREFFLPFGGGAYVLRYMLEDSTNPVIMRVYHSREDRQPIQSPPPGDRP